ncbi:MAG: iron-containing redox enzyme family protein [Pseudonocardiaceae bacterium]
MTTILGANSAQQRLYVYNRSLPDAATYTEIVNLEQQWVVPRAAALEHRAPPFTSRQELVSKLHELLGCEEADPPECDRYLAEQATLEQFKVVVAEFAVDGLVESQSHLPIIPRLPAKSRMAVFRVLIDEFGCGNNEQEHSALYRKLLTELGMPTELEHYIAAANDESFAYVNLFHWLAARASAPEYFLGAYAYFESSVLYAFKSFAAASERLGIRNSQYYTEHLYIDSFHSRQMLESIKALEEERPIDLAKVWAGIELTSTTVAHATEAAVAKARRLA